ncbi:unnamed protein product [Sphagnum tenellum]
MFNRRCTSVVKTKTAICFGNCGLGANSNRIPSRDSTEEQGVELNCVTFQFLPDFRSYADKLYGTVV